MFMFYNQPSTSSPKKQLTESWAGSQTTHSWIAKVSCHITSRPEITIEIVIGIEEGIVAGIDVHHFVVES